MNSTLDPQNEMHRLAHVSPEELGEAPAPTPAPEPPPVSPVGYVTTRRVRGGRIETFRPFRRTYSRRREFSVFIDKNGHSHDLD